MPTVLLALNSLRTMGTNSSADLPQTTCFDDIYELRAKHVGVQYRILYFFHGRNIAILAAAITKEEAAVPDIDIERAIERKRLFVENPETHTYVACAWCRAI